MKNITQIAIALTIGTTSISVTAKESVSNQEKNITMHGKVAKASEQPSKPKTKPPEPSIKKQNRVKIKGSEPL
jgi:hypothetical protein